MRYRELSKRLKRLGCYIEREGKGSHTVWYNPETKKKTVIPNHSNKDLAPGTIRGILMQLGISRQDFGPVK